MNEFRFERRVSLFTAVFIIAVVVFLIVRNDPIADPNLVVLARIILVLAVGMLGATIPGFLSVTYNLAGFSIRAAGALALFVIAFFGTPHVEALHLADGLELQTEIARHLANPDNCENALRESESLIRITPKAAIAHNLKGDAEYCLGNISNALKAFEDAANIDPSYQPAQYNKAAALIRLGKYVEAERILDSLITADKNDPSVRYNLAVAQAALKDYREAFKNFEIVYARDKSFDSSLGLGFLYVLLEAEVSEQKSTLHFKIAISIKPAIVCILYGKLPFDPNLQEEKPFVDVAHLAEGNETFLRVRSNFVTCSPICPRS
jgi:tetratricopeptide (TPR) repeat protein